MRSHRAGREMEGGELQFCVGRIRRLGRWPGSSKAVASIHESASTPVFVFARALWRKRILPAVVVDLPRTGRRVPLTEGPARHTLQGQLGDPQGGMYRTQFLERES